MSTRTAYFGAGEAGKQVLVGLKKCGPFNIVLTFEDKLEDSSKVANKLIEEKIELAIVCNYGQLLPKSLLNVPKYGFWNVHYSLLPKFRGATPVQSAILACERETGVTIIRMAEKLDQGDILVQKKLTLTGDETTPELKKTLSDIAVALLCENLTSYLKSPCPLERQKGESSYCYRSLLDRENAKINWTKRAEKVLRKIRAYLPDPCAWTELNGKNVKIVSAKIAPQMPGTAGGKTGTCFVSGGRVYVQTGSGHIELLEVCVSGKGKMSAKEFANGYVRDSVKFD